MEIIKAGSTDVKSSENQIKSTYTLLSEIRAEIRLLKSMSTVMFLLDSGAGMEECIFGRKKLRKDLDIFEKLMSVDFETNPYLARRCHSIMLTAEQLCSTKSLLRSMPIQNQKIRLVYRAELDEAPAVIRKKKKLIVPDDLLRRHRETMVLHTRRKPVDENPLLQRKKSFVFGFPFLLMVTAVAASLFSWHCIFYSGSKRTEVKDPLIKTYCEEFDRLKCENGGYPVDKGYGFVCKCVEGYYGGRCSHSETYSWMTFRYIGRLFDYTSSDLRRGMPLMWWSFLPFTSNLQHIAIVSFYQDHMKRMKKELYSDGGGNAMTNTRISPPNCSADDQLPPLDAVYDDIFRRKPDDRMKRDPRRRNMLYHAFYQYFVLQFFGEDFNSTVTGSQLYGTDDISRAELRSFAGGKLRTERRLNDQHYPPRLSLAKKLITAISRWKTGGPTRWFDRVADYATTNGRGHDGGWDVLLANAVSPLAASHPLLSTDPMLFAMHTLWVREHNRVCDQLAARHPEWTDERLYGAAKRIVVGQMMGIMMNDVLGAGGIRWPSKYDPAVHRARRAVDDHGPSTTPLEMLLTMMMPSGGADSTFSRDSSRVLDNDVGDTVRLMVDQPMGAMSSNNGGAETEPMTKVLMKLSRENAVQNFNRYRMRLGLPAYGSFYELTDNRETAGKLESLYENVDNVELLVGMLVEKTSYNSVPTFTVMMNSFIVNSIVMNPLYSKPMWNSDTFDGDYGFSVVKSTSIRTFICNNLQDECDNNDLIVDLYVK